MRHRTYIKRRDAGIPGEWIFCRNAYLHRGNPDECQFTQFRPLGDHCPSAACALHVVSESEHALDLAGHLLLGAAHRGRQGQCARRRHPGTGDPRHLFRGGRTFNTYAPNDPSLIQRLYGKGVSISARPQSDNVPWFVSLLVSWLPFIALIGVWIFLSRQMHGAGGKALGFGKSRAKLLTEAHGRVTFEDVAGVDEAKQDLQEIVEFLRDPGKFQRLGGRIPRGVLLVGPPGTGKTLIARAVAGEANVPFFTISGSDFVEMFVGVGASRVRDMFEQAKKNAP